MLELDQGKTRRGRSPTSSERYPFCIVWTPIPLLTWICPIIGHMGICDSRGVIYDFAGPYTIGEDDFAFGKTTRFLQLNPKLVRETVPSTESNHLSLEDTPQNYVEIWDNCVKQACSIYSGRVHNLCCDNCHSHVAMSLEGMRYAGVNHWNMFMLAIWMFFCGRFVSIPRFVSTFLPSVILAGIICAIYFSS
eukprot:c1916_g1_i1.p1 GENE.c1916_g1_i1~~c1916_g1_i1.p1  ORF type:complete len:192 (-),score=19.26 c1916_g1_i1:61-636(-)